MQRYLANLTYFIARTTGKICWRPCDQHFHCSDRICFTRLTGQQLFLTRIQDTYLHSRRARISQEYSRTWVFYLFGFTQFDIISSTVFLWKSSLTRQFLHFYLTNPEQWGFHAHQGHQGHQGNNFPFAKQYPKTCSSWCLFKLRNTGKGYGTANSSSIITREFYLRSQFLIRHLFNHYLFSLESTFQSRSFSFSTTPRPLDFPLRKRYTIFL